MEPIKRKIPTNLVIIITIFHFYSCGNNIGEDEYKLLYWSSNNPYEIEYADYIINKWNKQNPTVLIKYQPVPEGRSSEEIILAAVVGKTTPDIYSNMWQGDVEAYAQAGILIPLDSINGFIKYMYERCDSSVMEEITSNDGHIYQIPWKINPIMMIYNQDYLLEAGYSSPPKTYSQFFDAANKITKDTDGDGYFDRWFGYSEVKVDWWQRFFDYYPLYLGASGGASLVENNRAVFNNEYSVQVFTFLQNIYKNQYFPQERLSARQDAFLSGAIAIRFTGPWEMIHAEKFKDEDFRYSYSTMPVPDRHEGPAFTYGDPKNIVLFNTCRNPQLAWKFLSFFCRKDNELEFLKITTQYPRRKDLLTDSLFINYFDKNQMMKIFAEQAKYVRGTDASPILKEVFDLISQEYEACVIYGVKSPEDAVKDAADAVDLLFIDK
ncbi:extracellular solute-binding protein [Bacteroidota bacterium]